MTKPLQGRVGLHGTPVRQDQGKNQRQGELLLAGMGLTAIAVMLVLDANKAPSTTPTTPPGGPTGGQYAPVSVPSVPCSCAACAA